MRSMVEGASDSTLRCRRRMIVETRAPSTILRATRYGWSPFPAFAGQENSVALPPICRHGSAVLRAARFGA